MARPLYLPLLSLGLLGVLVTLAGDAAAQPSPPLPASDEPAFEEEEEGGVPGEPRPSEPPGWGIEGPYRLDLELVFGSGIRTDDPPNFSTVNAAGILVGGGLRVELSRHVAFGLGYEHIGLWREDTGVLTTGSYRIDRRLDSLWPTLRLYALRGDLGGLLIDLGLGPSWQGVSAAGSSWDPLRPAITQSLECSAGGGTGFAIRAAVGGEVRVSDPFSITAAVGLDSYRHHSQALGECAPGAGTITMVGLRLGMTYGWDL
ncbi:MAG: hypothetical protein R3B72_36735 [Polyangiaceae bacterium]